MAFRYQLQADCNRLRYELAEQRNLRRKTAGEDERLRLIMKIAELRITLCHSRNRLSDHLAEMAGRFKRIYD